MGLNQKLVWVSSTCTDFKSETHQISRLFEMKVDFYIEWFTIFVHVQVFKSAYKMLITFQCKHID